MDHGNHLHHGPGGPQAPWEDEAALAAVGARCSETQADPVIKRGYLTGPGPGPLQPHSSGAQLRFTGRPQSLGNWRRALVGVLCRAPASVAHTTGAAAALRRRAPAR